MGRKPHASHLALLAAVPAIAVLGLLLSSAPARAGDTDLFNTRVAPNVVFIFDNSSSMNHVVWHPAFRPGMHYEAGGCVAKGDPGYDPTCVESPLCDITASSASYTTSSGGSANFDDGANDDFGVFPGTADDDDFYTEDGLVDVTRCSNTRDVFVDTDVQAQGKQTIWNNEYLNWYFSDNVEVDDDGDGRTILEEIEDMDDGARSQCVLNQDNTLSTNYPLYQRSRITAAKDITREVICNTSLTADIRYGLARFFLATDPEGGFVTEAVDDYSSTHANNLFADVDSFSGETWTPLGETLYNVYRYFQSRNSTKTALGKTPPTRFPVYNITESGNISSTYAPPSPVQLPCQLNFVVIVTDGEPTKDDFDNMGYTTFTTNLIGDYNADGETEEGYADEGALYLDDIAKFMFDKDMFPDADHPNMPGKQNVEVYTVGFTTNQTANDLLRKTANVSNGEFFSSNNPEELTAALKDTIASVVNKAKSFTAATVPTSRTTDGNSFYSTYFQPQNDNPFWQGHLKAFGFTADGDIVTPAGKCATGVDPNAVPPCPPAGSLRIFEDGYWDAASAMPDPADRNLYYEAGATSVFGTPPLFEIPSGPGGDTTFAGILGITAADNADEPYASLSPNAPGDMAVALVDALRGCEWGSSPCVPRLSPTDGSKVYLGDIFHSNPVVVGSPNQALNDSSYQAFATTTANRERTRVIYAGSNEGFLHAFNAGNWDASATPPGHNRGTGEELFGFMPADVRDRIKDLPKDDTGIRQSVYVDGSPIVADVWMYRRVLGGGALSTNVDPTLPTLPSQPKAPEQWRTVLIGGLRDGGEGYYALDVTEPTAAAADTTPPFPLYLWGFPCDDCSNAINSSTSTEEPWVARTWSDPVITRVRVDISGMPRERWVAIFGAGYDELSDPNSSTYSTFGYAGKGIYMVDITTGKVLARKVYDPLASALGPADTAPKERYSELKYAVASAPAVFDLDFDGFADVIYIGDLGGNVWKWVVSNVGDDPINDISADRTQPNWPFRRIFRAGTSLEPTLPPEQRTPAAAYDSTVHYQSFFFPPTGVYGNGTLTLAFGAGERANPIGPAADWNDGDPTNNNHYYVVKDNDPFERIGATPHPITDSIDEADLEDLDGPSPLSCSAFNVSKRGYFFAGRDAEKFITTSVVFAGTVFTGSFLPSDPTSTNACLASGNAYLYEFDLECGTGKFTTEPTASDQRRKAIGEGLPTNPRISVGDLNQGGDPPCATPPCPPPPCKNKVIVVTTEGTIISEDQCIPTRGLEVRSWRQQ